MMQMDVNFWPVRISREVRSILIALSIYVTVCLTFRPAIRRALFREEILDVGGHILNISSAGGFNAKPFDGHI